MSASIGISVASRSDETPESLLRDADAAMYRAKNAGGGRYELFDNAMRAAVVGRLRIEKDVDLGRWVLETACEQGAAWQRRFGCPLKMFVNVSGRQVADPMFAGEVAKIVSRTGLLPKTLGPTSSSTTSADSGAPGRRATCSHARGRPRRSTGSWRNSCLWRPPTS